MARIPIADIPNAPQATPMPQGDAHSVNFGTALSLLQQPTLAQGAFDGPAVGAEKLGSALTGAGQDVGGALQQIAVHKKKADDDTAVINASAALEKAHADYQASLSPASDTNTWAPGLLQTLSDTAKPILADKSLSDDAKREIQNRLTSYSAQAYSSMTMAAAKESFNRSTQAHIQIAKQQLDSGDVEGAKSTYDVMAEKKLIYPEVADGLKVAADRTGEYNAASRAIATDPKAAYEAILDPKNFPTLSTSQRDTLTTDAQKGINERKKQALDFVTQGIETGKIADAEHADAIGNGYFDDTDKLKIEGMLNKAVGPSYATVFDLQKRIADYDPSKDQDGKVSYELYRDIKTTVPTNWQEPLMTKFNAAAKPDEPQASVKADGLQVIESAGKAGFFGTWNKKVLETQRPEQGKNQFIGTSRADYDAEFTKREAANKTMDQIRKDHEAWLQANPKASYPESRAWLNSRMRDEMLKQPQKTEWGLFHPSTWFQSNPANSSTPAAPASSAPTGTQQQIDAALKKWRGSMTGTGAGKVTSYGYTGDSTPDKNSAAGIGAFDNHLHKDSLAVSPDVEAKLTAAGIKPNDWIDLKMSDGSTVRKQFADRTANDTQAAKLGLQPLRGRWDFYSPTGKHPMDGQQVLSFSKANNT